MTMQIENFRPVSGVSRIYRCAKTEPLASITLPDCEASRVILEESGLVVDLRSKAEQDNLEAAKWMDRFGFSALDVATGDEIPESLEKRVMRIDVQPRERIFEYLTREWLSPAQRASVPMLLISNPERVHEMRMEALNARGLPGLNEAILESGGADLCTALKEITKHLERTTSSVVIHCVQGKDRTGMLSMLFQSILQLSDKDIIEDYFKSECMRDPSVAAQTFARGRFDKKVFTGAPRESMIATLSFVRNKYGTVCPGYLDAIGFDGPWRERFTACQTRDSRFSNSNSKL